MLSRDIKLKLLDLDDLPTLPEVIEKIFATTDNEDSSASDLSAILEVDHVITSRIIRLSNSAFYGLPQQVETVRRAVVVIGFEAVRMLALATSVFDVFLKQKQFALDPRDFWMHSFGTAKCAQLLAHRVEGLNSPEACLTGGLIHDIGKYVLAMTLKNTYHEVIEAASASNEPLIEMEHRLLGTTHAEVGAWTASQWNFPPRLVDVIHYSHDWHDYIGAYQPEVAVVALADSLSRIGGFGNAGESAEATVESELTSALSLSQSDVERLLDDLRKYRLDTEQLLDMLTEG